MPNQPLIKHTAHLLRMVDDKLIECLKTLTPDEWALPTNAPKWRVIDVAYHLLDGNIRGISSGRDQHFPKIPAAQGPFDLIAYLNELNATWVNNADRISPALLIELLAFTNEKYRDYLLGLAPEAKAIFSVGWAGEDTSRNWFHIAREYTEKWHHQQQIRQAVDQSEVLLRRELYQPFLETSACALPHHYKDVQAPTGTTIHIMVDEGLGAWCLQKTSNGWTFEEKMSDRVDCEIHLKKHTAWRLFTQKLKDTEIQAGITITGDTSLGDQIRNVIAVMA